MAKEDGIDLVKLHRKRYCESERTHNLNDEARRECNQPPALVQIRPLAGRCVYINDRNSHTHNTARATLDELY
ncbi:hypothetical protein Y032_1555g3917 [Ancylostoma ceylanicum]|uniref:Uncharacterized protein n=1 Tax=Ancylostoma ceylanicum TaxID=53326 RepID=A0A016W613_9BILA|nr:hypothetical protein Y032_1555g3917 [Ancylostoma ceylanicum]